MEEGAQLVFVKAGGSFLTVKDKPVTIRVEAFDSLVEILRDVGNKVKIVLGNGGGSFAHYAVGAYKGRPPAELLTKCQQATRSLNRLLVDYLIQNGLYASSLQTSAIMSFINNKIEVFGKPIIEMLKMGMIPVIYGECIPHDGGVRVVSTERAFRAIAEVARPSRIVLLTDVDGVYTCDPKSCRDARLFEEITSLNVDEVLEKLMGDAGRDQTGGIYGKVRSMAELSRELGVDVYITSGFDKESSINAVLGRRPKRGTRISL